MNFKLNINDDGNGNSNFSLEMDNSDYKKMNIIENKTKVEDKEDNDMTKRSKRQIKKIKCEETYMSEEHEPSIVEEQKIPVETEHDDENSDIVMSGNLLYRYSSDQIELEGFWAINSSSLKEKFSYLLLRKKDKIQCLIDKDMIDTFDPSSKYSYKNNYVLNVCSANLYELLTIPDSKIFVNILNFLTGEYHGFFMYYDKTIEDRFYLNLSLEENQVRISGDGTNNLGNFNLIGYINFYTSRSEIISRNTLESEVIHLGELQMTRLYNAFNPNENYRVIKSYQHRKKKDNESSEISSII